MTLQFEFRKDWSNGPVSFKNKQILNGDVIETGNKAPYTESNPQYKIEFKTPSGNAQIPFCFQGDAIAEPSVAPWLCNIGKIDLTPTPPPGSAVTPKGDDYKGPVQSLGAKIFSTRNIIIALVIIAIIVLYLKYGRKKK